MQRKDKNRLWKSCQAPQEHPLNSEQSRRFYGQRCRAWENENIKKSRRSDNLQGEGWWWEGAGSHHQEDFLRETADVQVRRAPERRLQMTRSNSMRKRKNNVCVKWRKRLILLLPMLQKTWFPVFASAVNSACWSQGYLGELSLTRASLSWEDETVWRTLTGLGSLGNILW